MWSLWAHILAAGVRFCGTRKGHTIQTDKLVQVIVGSVAAGDKSELVSTSLRDLELAIWLLKEAYHHPVPRKGLVSEICFVQLSWLIPECCLSFLSTAYPNTASR